MAQMGRPRTFDRDEAIQQAMFLFWEYGYDSTSLSLLKLNIGGGITAPSFYAAFGSKEALFQEVVEHYLATHGQVISSLWDENLRPREAIELALRRSAKMQTELNHPKGCLLVLSAGACSPENERIQKFLSKQRAKTREKFQQCIQRAVDTLSLPADTEVCAYAASLHSFLLGLSMQARDGVSGTVLNHAVTELMHDWDARTASIKI
ncbi:TetR/AcrR family transcriptional regulator [Acinetobacter sp. ANC 3882]|uniref:TetR/AcrR family transcriptional regulator n=1 Tax=Acinetobacter sp. ANC 3882 TaxID=2923423 RepID=UPI001F4BC68E|nr:TetR/AcrR family transcriptional regulator [Acinetobacter sp. ANC 3882]MCH7315017.1 TetR/AcrR family transcriptional regulator [Acinetobacter sp. ANC 3882]